jgi:serine/threonine protein phosphatase PrpC
MLSTYALLFATPAALCHCHLQWDVMSDKDACTVVRRHMQQAGAPRQLTPPQLLPGGGGGFGGQLRRPPQLTAALATSAAERLVQESLDRGTMDNITAVVGLLQWD